MILIHPPIVKPSEPPQGLARLAGTLSFYGVRHIELDANLEALYYLLARSDQGDDTWTRRAVRNLPANLAALKSWPLYNNYDRYRRAVLDTNHLLQMSLPEKEIHISLGDYDNRSLSPLKSNDLLYAAEHPEENPFYLYFMSRLTGLVKEHDPKVVGFSLNYLSQALCAFAMIGFLRQSFPYLILVAGGGLITSWLSNPGWRNPFKGLLDHLVAGPGEGPLLTILGKPVSGPIADVTPSFEGLPLTNYLSPVPILPYSASTGCYWGECYFCPEKAEGGGYRQRSHEQVLTDLFDLSSSTRCGLIHLTDNALSPSLLRRLADNPPEPPWYGFARITDHLANLDFCRALKSSGCAMLKVGLESGDQDVLDFMKKGNDLATSSAALRTLKQAGIATYVYLLFGTPSETAESARKTLDFVVTHSNYIDFLNTAIFNLPLNSHDAAQLETRTFYEGDLSLYVDFRHPHGWDRKEVRRFLDDEFRKHPAIRPILHRRPPIFTSNHAPLLIIGQDRLRAAHKR